MPPLESEQQDWAEHGLFHLVHMVELLNQGEKEESFQHYRALHSILEDFFNYADITETTTENNPNEIHPHEVEEFIKSGLTAEEFKKRKSH